MQPFYNCLRLTWYNRKRAGQHTEANRISSVCRLKNLFLIVLSHLSKRTFSPRIVPFSYCVVCKSILTIFGVLNDFFGNCKIISK